MNTSKVYFTNLRTTPSSNLLDKMERLVKRAGIANIDFKNQFVAIKIHFGEPGNLAYIRPNYAARLVSLLRELGAKPFLTDCNTLYSDRLGEIKLCHGAAPTLSIIFKAPWKMGSIPCPPVATLSSPMA